jgi:beta-1,4-mannosyl-glycoprotein beta-1,4-N-acetylglucosaminyltransferase
MIYDCFTFFNELDLLEIRLNVLDDVVDKFVLVEATRTFTNKEKELVFEKNKERFAKFKDKIIHIIVDEFPEFDNAWTFEFYQRNSINRGLSNCKDDDVILISDLDEIPNPESVKKYANTRGIKVFKQKMFYYFINCRNISEPYWVNSATRILSFADFKKNNSSAQTARFLKGKVVGQGGWHFSYLGGIEAIMNKIKSYSHQEYKESFDEAVILKRIEKGQYLFPDSNNRYVNFSLDDTYPKYIRDNKEKYKHLINKVNYSPKDVITLFINEIKSNIIILLKQIKNRTLANIKMIKATIRKVIPSTANEIENILSKELAGNKKVLDLGCGKNSPIRFLKDKKGFENLYTLGVDIFTPYIDLNKNGDHIHSEYLNSNIFEIQFPDKSFDTAILFDVVEHFDRNDFLEFLPKLEKIVSKIIVITPNGFIEQGDHDKNPYQSHRSGWTVADFNSLGFTCTGLSGYKPFYTMKYIPSLLRILISDISNFFVKNKPEKAFHLVAIKTTK